jgi:hypothetical protein
MRWRECWLALGQTKKLLRTPKTDRNKESNRMRTKLAVVMVGLGLVLTAVPVRAHHAFAAEFDAKKPVKLRGTVTKMEWINPHAWIHIDVKGADGTTTSWMVEGGTPNTLFRRGLTKDSLAVGTEIVVDGYQAKDGSNRANGRDITFTDGRKLFLGASSSDAPYAGKDGEK